MINKIVNALLFQVAWFAAVLGAAKGLPWLGTAILLPILVVNLTMADNRRSELMLVLVAGVLGFLFDTGLVAIGVFTPKQYLLPSPCSPPWMVGLWINFAATLNVSLSWLRGRYIMSALLGAIGGPLAYYSGANLGATETVPTLTGLIVLAVGWGIMTPLLYWLAAFFRVRG